MSHYTTAGHHGMFGGAVCFPNGQLRFTVRLGDYLTWGPTYYNIVRADGSPVPNSNLRCTVTDEVAQPVIIPRPGNGNQYYIFYPYANGLLYSLLDMSLNGGQGGIVVGQKDIVIAPYGTVIAQKMAPVKGCDGVWLVVRSRIMNGYYSYHVSRDGIDTTKIVSHAGMQPIYDMIGYLKSSPDGSLLGLASYYGVELYTFEKCSGKIKDFGIIESTNNPLPYAQSFYNCRRFTDVAFSPDSKKLYATYNRNRPDITGFAADSGKLIQYDLSTFDISSIIASRNVVLINIHSIVGDISACLAHTPNPLGEIKMGPDGKLYVDNGSVTCRPPWALVSGYNPGPGFHRLNYPNLTGISTGPELNVIDVSAPTSYGGDFYRSGLGGQSWLPQDIIVNNERPDTVEGSSLLKIACFVDSLTLKANDSGSCYRWNDSSTSQYRTVYQDGKYFVRYFQNCHITTDTFNVIFVKSPEAIATPACPGLFNGMIAVNFEAPDTGHYTFTWYDGKGGIIDQRIKGRFDTLINLDTGAYQLKISIAGGCETKVDISIPALPVPEIITDPAQATIRYGDSITLHASGALFYVWTPSGSLDSAVKSDPVAHPVQATLYTVRGWNDYGCTDTGYVKVDIDFSAVELLPNAFSPNGDGLNDQFRLEGAKFQKLDHFRIFNRYGQLVFTTSDIKKGWDGTYNGRQCESGTYYYDIGIYYPDGSLKFFKGDVLLIR